MAVYRITRFSSSDMDKAMELAESVRASMSELKFDFIDVAQDDQGNGVVIARGGPAQGYALLFQKGKPQFSVRSNGELSTVTASAKAAKRWVHLCGVLTDDKKLKLYVDGKLAATAKASSRVSPPGSRPGRFPWSVQLNQTSRSVERAASAATAASRPKESVSQRRTSTRGARRSRFARLLA